VTRPTLIEVPYDLGHEGVNGGAGVALLAEALHDERSDRVAVVLEEGTRAETRNEIAASMAVVRALAGRVREVVAGGGLPVVLAANCHSSLGTVAGLGGGVGVVWLDAHADFNTPESTPSGFFDGMAAALLTGAGWAKLRAQVEGHEPVPEEHFAYVGMRDADDGERERLAASRVHQAAGLDDLATTLDALREPVDAVYLHIDLDVLDPSAGRANPWAVEGGLQADELARAIDLVGERFAVRAAAFTAYWPESDPERRIPPIARTAFERILATRPVTA
jgi:arginase